MTAAKNALSGDESDSENENAVTDSEDEDQAYQNTNLHGYISSWPARKIDLQHNSTNFYYLLSAKTHVRMDKFNNPCEESLEYSFNDCVKAWVVSNIGCRPVWNEDIDNNFKNCDKDTIQSKSKNIAFIISHNLHLHFTTTKVYSY